MGVFHHDTTPPQDFLDMFLLTLYQGLSSGDKVEATARLTLDARLLIDSSRISST